MKRACVILADGCEEVEAVTSIDYLRRAGIEVRVLGLGSQRVVGGHGIVLGVDASFSEVADLAFDAVVVPGGMKGAARIASSAEARALLGSQLASGRLVAAICAAPVVVLHRACGLLKGRRFTCYPGMEEEVSGATFVSERVVQDGNLLTSEGPGTAGEFAVAIVGALLGEEAAAKVAAGALLP